MIGSIKKNNSSSIDCLLIKHYIEQQRQMALEFLMESLKEG